MVTELAGNAAARRPWRLGVETGGAILPIRFSFMRMPLHP
jgi:hypothetical protein